MCHETRDDKEVYSENWCTIEDDDHKEGEVRQSRGFGGAKQGINKRLTIKSQLLQGR
jgi:hypothetical protein